MKIRDDAMFWCPNYGVKSPARWVRFSAKTGEDLRVFAFWPSRRKLDPAKLKLTYVDGRLNVRLKSRTYSFPMERKD